jgi:hypothetical protein
VEMKIVESDSFMPTLMSEINWQTKAETKPSFMSYSPSEPPLRAHSRGTKQATSRVFVELAYTTTHTYTPIYPYAYPCLFSDLWPMSAPTCLVCPFRFSYFSGRGGNDHPSRPGLEPLSSLAICNKHTFPLQAAIRFCYYGKECYVES